MSNCKGLKPISSVKTKFSNKRVVCCNDVCWIYVTQLPASLFGKPYLQKASHLLQTLLLRTRISTMNCNS